MVRIQVRAVVSHTPSTNKIAYLSYLLGLLLIVFSHFQPRQRCGAPEDFWKFSETNHDRLGPVQTKTLSLSGIRPRLGITGRRVFLPPPNMSRLPLVETAHSSNTNVMFHGGTFNSVQGDFHFHHSDSESGMHNFRSVQKFILIAGQM